MMCVLGYRLDRGETQYPVSTPDIVKHPRKRLANFLMLLIAALTNVVVVVSVSHACDPAVTPCVHAPRVSTIV